MMSNDESSHLCCEFLHNSHNALCIFIKSADVLLYPSVKINQTENSFIENSLYPFIWPNKGVWDLKFKLLLNHKDNMTAPNQQLYQRISLSEVSHGSYGELHQ